MRQFLICLTIGVFALMAGADTSVLLRVADVPGYHLHDTASYTDSVAELDSESRALVPRTRLIATWREDWSTIPLSTWRQARREGRLKSLSWQVINIYRRTLATPAEALVWANHEFELDYQLGSYRWLETSGTPVGDRSWIETYRGTDPFMAKKSNDSLTLIFVTGSSVVKFSAVGSLPVDRRWAEGIARVVAARAR